MAAVPRTGGDEGPLAGFSPMTRAWFQSAFAAPTTAQDGAWRAIGAGKDSLVVAPTGSGKTLAAFLAALDPLAGLRAAAARLDLPLPEIVVGMRTGDTPADARRRFPAHPPDILITTPESLYLLLTSRAREALRHLDTVIVDEVHSVVATKRGA